LDACGRASRCSGAQHARSCRAFATAPLFWSDQYGIKIQFAGRSKPDDEVVLVQGSIEQERFVALYGRAGRLVGVLTFQRPAQLAKYRALIRAQASFEQAIALSRA
jgi:hypothetical protein